MKCCGLNKDYSRCGFKTKKVLKKDLKRFNLLSDGEFEIYYYAYCKKHNKSINEINNNNTFLYINHNMCRYTINVYNIYYQIIFTSYANFNYNTTYDNRLIKDGNYNIKYDYKKINKINKEELCKEAFKPSRLLNRINLYGEDYEFI